jgi:cytochrome b subunit of formate dehydrogenase
MYPNSPISPNFIVSVSFKVFTKVGTNRLIRIAHEVKPTQIAFVLGTHILEGVLVLHETIHGIYKGKWTMFFKKKILSKHAVK